MEEKSDKIYQDVFEELQQFKNSGNGRGLETPQIGYKVGTTQPRTTMNDYLKEASKYSPS